MALTASVLRIGTRGSPLALAQTAAARAWLSRACSDLAAPGATEVVAIRTTGDAARDRPLAEIGGKGLFTKEIDEALLSGRVDLAVHSVKDLPTWLPQGIVLACVLPRGDPRDALILRGGGDGLADLPAGALVGTASLRRQAQLLHRRPDLRVESLRGNVQTRLDKVAQGRLDATLLALAGLERLGLENKASAVLESDEMLPAVGQAAIGITCRDDGGALRELLVAAADADTMAEVTAERALLAVLDGSCRTPIAGLARARGSGDLHLRGLVARPDGRLIIDADGGGASTDALRIGHEVGAILKSRAGPGLLAS